ncbi:MAG: hypothetical protein WCK35_11480 [Chloroflexota bacterium]
MINESANRRGFLQAELSQAFVALGSDVQRAFAVGEKEIIEDPIIEQTDREVNGFFEPLAIFGNTIAVVCEIPIVCNCDSFANSLHY